ncbi:carboxypeptidase B-like [Rhynchophorus ferrugineus]|uniref:Peptidase M14 domain-containing protein n=1 Tax=Rhynchophorus ferrugineus TaxID=354439 RepID=A0A834IKM7_RHYFE|nr:hypothetical protein GWI33_002108 [Rhynchophorus ferrugineus]
MEKALVLVVLLALGANSEFSGYKVYKVTPKTQDHVKFLRGLSDETYFDFLKHPRSLGDYGDIMVAPEVQGFFETMLRGFSGTGLEFNVTIDDVQRALEEDKQEPSPRDDSLFTSFQSHADMNAYLRTLELRFPQVVKVVSIGKSYEGRDLLVIKIGSGDPNLPTIFVDAGIHAREWIAPPAALYIINQLLENPANVRLYQNVNWHIIPSLNPDGYEFSRSTTSNRLWRKTRQPNAGSTCFGADPNRNFDYYWMYAGASSAPCSDVFAGPVAFSEPETAAVAAHILENRNTIKLYLSFHSYGNMMLYPWGYTSALPENAAELQWLGEQASAAIERASTIGSQYVTGSSTNVLYEAAGGSDDWVKGVAGVSLAYTIELPAGGIFGFNPPERSILPMVQETFEGIRVFHDYIERKYVV